jgi:hypothetical protein
MTQPLPQTFHETSVFCSVLPFNAAYLNTPFELRKDAVYRKAMNELDGEGSRPDLF